MTSLCLLFSLCSSETFAQGPGLYKGEEKLVDFGDVDDFLSAVEKTTKRQTPGMVFYNQIMGERPSDLFGPQREYISLVLKCRDLVGRMTPSGGEGAEASDDIDRLLAVQDGLGAANMRLLERFSQIEERIRDSQYPADKIQRHIGMVEQHSAVADRLMELLEDLRVAHYENNELERGTALQELRRFFAANVFRPEPPLFHSQPLPVMVQPRQAPIVLEDEAIPREGLTYPTSGGRERGPDPADLDPTIDVQFTDEIIALADSLNRSPVEMYNFVRNNFEFEAYLGSRKGSQQTLDHERGNDYDQASLLIALLRVAGIPARYATGTIRMPVDQATNWLGIDDKLNAASLLATAGMEAVLYISGPDTVAIGCRRVWVEAWLPYVNYRGAINDSVGRTWIPIDPVFKQYTYDRGINFPAEIGFDGDAFIDDYLSTFRPEPPIEVFRQMLLDELPGYHPEATYEDLFTTRSVIEETDGILPGTLPYELMTFDGTFSEIATNKRYYIRFHVHGQGTDLDYSTSLPEIVQKQVTISYVGATPADQQIIDDAGGIFHVEDPYLVDLKPVLKIDGCEVATGSGEVMMGLTHYSDMHFTAPEGASNVIPVVYNVITAGNYQGIGIDTEDAFPAVFDLPETSCDEDLLGQELHQTAITYLNNVDVAGDEAARLMHNVVMNDVSEAIVENTVLVYFSGGLPITFDWTGMIVDADRKIIGPFSVDGVDNSCDYMRLGGADGSVQENRLFELRFDEEAISTIKILQLAADSAITVCEITTSIPADCPNIDQPSHVIDAINAALAQGHHVIIPERQFTYYEWTGTGWIDLDPASCAAGYIISGGHGGGATVQEWDILYPDLYCIEPIGPITVTPSAQDDYYCADSNDKWTFTVPTINYWGKDADGNCQLLNSASKDFDVQYTIEYIADRWGPGDYVFRVGSYTTECGCTMIDKTVTIVEIEDIDGYIYGSWLRKVSDMHDLSSPANVIASGYIEFDAEVHPASARNDLYYKWSVTSGGGSLTDPEGTGSDYLDVDWDAPDDHLKDITLTLEVKASAGAPVLCTETVDLRTVRPYVIRVKFEDDTWFFNEEQQIADGNDPEYDAGVAYPVCYRKNTGMQLEADVAGDKTNNSINDLIKKTKIKVTAEAVYGGITNPYDEDTVDGDTEDWSGSNFPIDIESDNAVPDEVAEYEDFEMHWTFKVKNSSGNWVTAYEEQTGYSQKTIHKQTAGGKTYGLYITYASEKFSNNSEFRKLPLDYACTWTAGQNAPDDIRSDLMTNGFVAHYAWNYQCHLLASDFVRMCKSLGIQGSLHNWASNASPPPRPANAGDMCYQRTVAFDPVGGINGYGQYEWSWHQWAESGGDQYDPSANAIHAGGWGGYEDAAFSDYYRCVTGPPTPTYAWEANQPGQSQGCESRGIHSKPAMEPWYGPNVP
jgi:hypothetical protein